MATTDRRYVIVGNGIAGTTAAEHLRRGDPYARITLITDEPYPLYNRIALPPFLKRKVTEGKVMIKDVPWHEEQRIELRLTTRVTYVDVGRRIVVLQDRGGKASGEELPYDALLVATGGRPNSLHVPGGQAFGVCNFQTLDDSKRLMANLESARRAITVGGSYIAYELTEAFRTRGLEVTWLMRGPWFLRRILEEEGGRLVDEIAASHGVMVIHGEEVAEVHTRSGDVVGVTTTAGRRLDADLVGVGVGITRNTELLTCSGVELRSGVVTDECLRTSVPDVYAAGDVAEFCDTSLGCHNMMGTWDNATAQGRLAATNMLGGNARYAEVPTYSTTLFHSRIAAVGATPDLVPDLEAVHRVDRAAGTYRRLFFLPTGSGDRLVGAVLIGERRGRQRLIDIIRSRIPIDRSQRGALLDL